MRALTLTQPYCGLVASGIKTVENRPRPMIKREDFGKPFALHASREIDGDVLHETLPRLAPNLFSDRDLTDEEIMIEPEWRRLAHITSAVIAVATVRDVLGIGGNSPETTLRMLERLGIPEQLRWTLGPTVYVLSDITVLREPVPCRGWQGFWTLSPDLERAVRTSLQGSEP